MSNLLPRIEFLAQSLWRRQRFCPYCGSRQRELVGRKHLLVRVRRCRDCALCYTDPIYDRSAFGELYGGLYGGEGSTTRMPERAALERLLGDSFRGSDKHAGVRLAGLAALSSGKRLFELGSSWGYFLWQARRAGFQAVGVEIARDRREYGRRELGLSAVDSLRELEAGAFDLGYSAHALEHFTDLSTVLDELSRALRVGGALVVEVPNFDVANRGAQAFSQVGAVHPIGFDARFFERNLPRHGLRLVGFFDSWSEFPERPRPTARGAELLLLAQKTSEPSS